MKVYINPETNIRSEILARPVIDLRHLQPGIFAILDDIRINGDVAVKKYTAKFDGVAPQELSVTEQEFREAIANVDAELKDAINLAKTNITLFHRAQVEQPSELETMSGVICSRKSVPIEKVGLYIPGGTAPLFSTVLMLGIPALLAGCRDIIICTPPEKSGKINPVVLYVAQLIGIKRIYKIGGVQAIAAMSYGTKTVSKVNKIFGPGNQYVTCAKQLVNAQGVAIDMPAGPSELAVFADDTCNPAFVAADLLSQAEHGTDSHLVLVASSISIIEKVQSAIQTQLPLLPRRDIAALALDNSIGIVVENIVEAFTVLNEYAPEHLIIASDHAEELADLVVNAGSVFLGHYSPESAGDYASGTNHTLPTNGYAKAYSGVSVDSFVKKITFQQISKKGLQCIGPAVEIMAAAEGLYAHKNAVTLRLNTLKNENGI